MNTYLVYGYDNNLLCEIKTDNIQVVTTENTCTYVFYDNNNKSEVYIGGLFVHHIIMIDSCGRIHNDLDIPFKEVL